LKFRQAADQGYAYLDDERLAVGRTAGQPATARRDDPGRSAVTELCGRGISDPAPVQTGVRLRDNRPERVLHHHRNENAADVQGLVFGEHLGEAISIQRAQPNFRPPTSKTVGLVPGGYIQVTSVLDKNRLS